VSKGAASRWLRYCPKPSAAESANGVTVSHFTSKGTTAAALYPAVTVTGSANGSPNSGGNVEVPRVPNHVRAIKDLKAEDMRAIAEYVQSE
jgi:hypothetical protein